jgi:hypothetical protein
VARKLNTKPSEIVLYRNGVRQSARDWDKPLWELCFNTGDTLIADHCSSVDVVAPYVSDAQAFHGYGDVLLQCLSPFLDCSGLASFSLVGKEYHRAQDIIKQRVASVLASYQPACQRSFSVVPPAQWHSEYDLTLPNPLLVSTTSRLCPPVIPAGECSVPVGYLSNGQVEGIGSDLNSLYSGYLPSIPDQNTEWTGTERRGILKWFSLLLVAYLFDGWTPMDNYGMNQSHDYLIRWLSVHTVEIITSMTTKSDYFRPYWDLLPFVGSLKLCTYFETGNSRTDESTRLNNLKEWVRDFAERIRTRRTSAFLQRLSFSSGDKHRLLAYQWYTASPGLHEHLEHFGFHAPHYRGHSYQRDTP